MANTNDPQIYRELSLISAYNSDDSICKWTIFIDNNFHDKFFFI